MKKIVPALQASALTAMRRLDSQVERESKLDAASREAVEIARGIQREVDKLRHRIDEFTESCLQGIVGVLGEEAIDDIEIHMSSMSEGDAGFKQFSRDVWVRGELVVRIRVEQISESVVRLAADWIEDGPEDATPSSEV